MLFTPHDHARTDHFHGYIAIWSRNQRAGWDALGHRPIGMVRHRVRFGLDGPPEVGDLTVAVVPGFDAGHVRRRQRHGGGVDERLDVVLHHTKPRPDGGGDAGLAAEGGEGGDQWCGHASGISLSRCLRLMRAALPFADRHSPVCS